MPLFAYDRGASTEPEWFAQNCDAGSVAHVADAASVGGLSWGGPPAQRMHHTIAGPIQRYMHLDDRELADAQDLVE